MGGQAEPPRSGLGKASATRGGRQPLGWTRQQAAARSPAPAAAAPAVSPRACHAWSDPWGHRLCCTRLHGLARGCVELRGVAWGCSLGAWGCGAPPLDIPPESIDLLRVARLHARLALLRLHLRLHLPLLAVHPRLPHPLPSHLLHRLEISVEISRVAAAEARELSQHRPAQRCGADARCGRRTTAGGSGNALGQGLQPGGRGWPPRRRLAASTRNGGCASSTRGTGAAALFDERAGARDELGRVVIERRHRGVHCAQSRATALLGQSPRAQRLPGGRIRLLQDPELLPYRLRGELRERRQRPVVRRQDQLPRGGCALRDHQLGS